MNILALETSCDETSAAIVQDGRHILASVIASQIDIHKKYGGVVPEVASRQHILSITPVLTETLEKAALDWSAIDAVAVTNGPGLAGALLVGVNVGKAIAFARQKPLIGVNHLESHIYSNWLIPPDAQEKGEVPPAPQFPLICLIVSGGHTEIVLITKHGQYQLLGKTQDDAAGEAFDKVSRLLGLGYPGGPLVENAALTGDPNRFPFTRSWLRGTYDFSFSGLKTAVLRKVQEYQPAPSRPAPFNGKAEEKTARPDLPPPAANTTLPVADIAASFQQAVVEILATKTVAAAEKHGAKAIIIAGGVAANKALRDALIAQAKKMLKPIPVNFPPLVYCTDNGAMVAAAAYFKLKNAKEPPSSLNLDIHPHWELTS
jgi:N6-L-threonylcarbamoyladenine synthase